MLVEVHKARKRARLRKPEWQDIRPDEPELRGAYAIAARNVDKFARAYMALTRALLTPHVERELLKRLREDTPEQALDAIPWYNPAVEETRKVWERLAWKLQDAYADVIRETGMAEYKQLRIHLKFEVQKAEKIPVVPVNPFSIKWIREHSSEMIREVSDSTKQAIRNIINRSFERGIRAEAILPDIKRSIGLLEREEIAVQNRLNMMLGEGVPYNQATKVADRYAKQLHHKRAERIARTETITAQSQGRRDAWQLAREEGYLPVNVEREWMAAPGSPITCEICAELHGKRAKIGEPYMSDVLGRAVEGPGSPAHPNCRCSERLVRPRE